MVTEAEYNWALEATKDTPYLAQTGGRWSFFCDDLGENWPRYNVTALYTHNRSPISRIPMQAMLCLSQVHNLIYVPPSSLLCYIQTYLYIVITISSSISCIIINHAIPHQNTHIRIEKPSPYAGWQTSNLNFPDAGMRHVKTTNENRWKDIFPWIHIIQTHCDILKSW